MTEIFPNISVQSGPLQMKPKVGKALLDFHPFFDKFLPLQGYSRLLKYIKRNVTTAIPKLVIVDNCFFV